MGGGVHELHVCVFVRVRDTHTHRHMHTHVFPHALARVNGMQERCWHLFSREITKANINQPKSRHVNVYVCTYIYFYICIHIHIHIHICIYIYIYVYIYIHIRTNKSMKLYKYIGMCADMYKCKLYVYMHPCVTCIGALPTRDRGPRNGQTRSALYMILFI